MANEPAGLRLGRIERFVLETAGAWDGSGGLVIEPSERSLRQSLLRAAKRLEVAGLLTRARVWRCRRVRDVRRAQPYLAEGRFWVRRDATRRHCVERVAVWRTAFGEGILRQYRTELRLGQRIRWDDERVSAARHFADYKWRDPEIFRASIAAHDHRGEARHPDEEEIHEARDEYLPRRGNRFATRERSPSPRSSG
jgi:hypothetical protein